jgi:3-hydroxyacyl-[acyl-carrier-protein] dehydratase
MEEKVIFDTQQIHEILPHRYPFLMIDKIVDFVDNTSIVGIKCVTVNEPFFTGHFPGRPVMPGVMILEAMAQTGAIMAKKSSNGVAPGKILFLVSADDVKWKKQVVPGDVLRIEMIFDKRKGPFWILHGSATVDGKLAASCKLTAAEV